MVEKHCRLLMVFVVLYLTTITRGGVCVYVCVFLKPADWPVMFRSEQHVLTLAVDSPSFHYTTIHPGLSEWMCVLLWKHYYQSHVCTHTHRHTEWQTCLAVEGGEWYLQDATDRVQTSAAELGIRLGTSAGRISLSLLNLSADSSKTSAHFLFTRFNCDSLASLCIWECVSQPCPSFPG